MTISATTTRIYLVILISSCSFFYLRAQDVRAFCVIDQQPILVGDTFEVMVHVMGVLNQPGVVDFSSWKKQIPEEDILRRTLWEKKGNQWVQRATIIALDSMEIALPPLAIPGPNGLVLQTSPTAIKIVPTILKPGETLENNRSIKKEPIRWSDLFASLVVFFIFGGGFWYYYIKREKKRDIVVVENNSPTPRSFEEEAIQRLHLLEEQSIWENGEIKKFYIELSQIIKGYLEARYEIPALESTTEELDRLLRGAKMQETLIVEIKNVLIEADLAKYAQQYSSSRDFRQLLSLVERLVIQSGN